MRFDITFDYRFDSHGFFTDGVREVMSAAAEAWESVITESFRNIPPGIELRFEDPSQAPVERRVNLSAPIDDLRIFVGAQDPALGKDGEALARSAVRGFAQRSDLLRHRIADDYRGDGPVTDFEPFLGLLSIDRDRTWNRDMDAPAEDEYDLYTVVLHEIGHVLGIGQAPVFYDLAAGGSFDAPNARTVNDGAPVPIAEDRAHIVPGYRDGDPLMAPVLNRGVREGIDPTDKALLADIGYAIDGFSAQGRQPRVATDESQSGLRDGDERAIVGSRVADLLDGLGGADRIRARDGADRVYGGAGDDVIFGGPGDDYLFGGRGTDQLQGGAGADLLHAGPDGNGTLYGEGAGIDGAAGADTFYVAPGDAARGDAAATVRIADFELAGETLLIDPAFGFTSPDAVLATAAKPYSNITRLDLTGAGGATTRIDVRHEARPEVPLTADNIVIGAPDMPAGKAINGAPLARPDVVTLAGGARVVDVLANDADPDGDQLTAAVPSTPDGLDVRVVRDDGRDVLQIARTAAFDGAARFAYIASDGNGGLDRAAVQVAASADAAASGLDLLDLDLAQRATALYVGYFGRAPDPGGLAFWTDQLARATDPVAEGGKGHDPERALQDMAEALRTSDEAIELFPLLDPTRAADGIGRAATADFVDSVYDNLFNRTPEPAGRDFWVATLQDRFAAGQAIGDAIVDVIAGAQGDDVRTFRNKVAAGLSFAETMDATRFDALSDGPDRARALIDGVGTADSSVANAVAQIGEIALVGQPGAFATSAGDPDAAA